MFDLIRVITDRGVLNRKPGPPRFWLVHDYYHGGVRRIAVMPPSAVPEDEWVRLREGSDAEEWPGPTIQATAVSGLEEGVAALEGHYVLYSAVDALRSND